MLKIAQKSYKMEHLEKNGKDIKIRDLQYLQFSEITFGYAHYIRYLGFQVLGF